MSIFRKKYKFKLKSHQFYTFTSQALDFSTYERLASSGALPLYVVYVVIMVISFTVLTLVKWRHAPETEKTRVNGPEVTNNNPRVVTRSDSRATMYHERQQQQPDPVVNGGHGVSTGSWYLDTLQSRPDTCFHVAMSIVLGVLAASTLRMKCFWTPYICVLASAGLADKTLWSVLVKRVTGGLSQGTVNLVRHIAIACLIIVLFTKHKPV